MEVRKHYNRNKEGKKQETKVLRRDQLLEKIYLLDKGQHQALPVFLYLTAARVEEVVKYVEESQPNRVLMIMDKETGKRIPTPAPILERVSKGEPIKRNQIVIEEKRITIYDVRTLKRKIDVMLTRPIPIARTEREEEMIKILVNYLNTLEPNDYLFNFTRQRAKQILEKVMLYCHLLRHCRLTHLAVDYGFDNSDLRQYTNWASSKTADNYVHKNISNLYDKMERDSR